MDDYFQKKRKSIFLFSSLLKKKSRLKKIIKPNKINVLLIIILILCMRLFFYTFFKDKALARNKKIVRSDECILIDPLKNIRKDTSFFSQKTAQFCQKDGIKSKSQRKIAIRKKEYKDLVKGHPIEAMVPAIAKQDEEVSAFLISIAKKESNWGIHAPKKQGKNCYNYWGYRGSYNRTASGYSCFDSPEQAISVVGRRIKNLIQKKIDTPQKMVVWKCGSSCAGFPSKNVQKWISDVSFYYNKLVS